MSFSSSATFDHLHGLAGAPELDDQQLFLLVHCGEYGLGEVETKGVEVAERFRAGRHSLLFQWVDNLYGHSRDLGVAITRMSVDRTRLLITADSGGSNGSRLRLWTTELAAFADETGVSITVCHPPPGTSNWNKIEYRLFSFISKNWRGQPLTSHHAQLDRIVLRGASQFRLAREATAPASLSATPSSPTPD